MNKLDINEIPDNQLEAFSSHINTLIDSVKKSIELFQKGIQADLIFCDIHLADGLSFDIFSEVLISLLRIPLSALNK